MSLVVQTRRLRSARPKEPPLMTEPASTLDWPLNVGGREVVPLRKATSQQLRLAAIIADEKHNPDLSDLAGAFRRIAEQLEDHQPAEALGDDRLRSLIFQEVRSDG
jgi:hypothetical protein